MSAHVGFLATDGSQASLVATIKGFGTHNITNYASWATAFSVDILDPQEVKDNKLTWLFARQLQYKIFKGKL